MTDLVDNYIQDPEFARFVISASGTSMAPTIVHRDRLHMERLESAPAIGDIVLAKGKSGRFYLHRLISAGPSFSTKGDACDAPDEELQLMFAKVVRIEMTLRSRLTRASMALRRMFRGN